MYNVMYKLFNTSYIILKYLFFTLTVCIAQFVSQLAHSRLKGRLIHVWSTQASDSTLLHSN